MTSAEYRGLIPLSLASALIYLAIAMFVLWKGHPQEDAYILYIYAENWANTGVISYFNGGPPAEGATDFLWMAIIAGLFFMGINSAISVALLNSLGIGLISFLLLSEIRVRNGGKLLEFGFAFLLPLYLIAQASYAGFSVALYASLVLVIFVGLYRWKSEKLFWIPILSIILGLFRPDGVIIGVAATSIGLFLAEGVDRRKYLLVCSGAALVGLSYFLWRWSYFSQLFPLPLYVKSSSDVPLPGLGTNLHWAKINIALIALFLVAIVINSRNRHRFVLASVPPLLLLVILAFAEQSQNISFRFQAPVSVILLMGSAIALSILMDKVRNSGPVIRASIGLVIVAVFLAGHYTYHSKLTYFMVRDALDAQHINFLPFLARKAFTQNSTIALTEAGRLAYWLPGKKFDLVGLNTAETARFGASAQYLDEVDPDLIFTLMPGQVKKYCLLGEDFCEPGRLLFRNEDNGTSNYAVEDIENRLDRSKAAIYEFLDRTTTPYRKFVASYGQDYLYLYAIKTDGNVNVDVFLDGLAQSHSVEGRLSYFDMVKRRNEF